MEGHLLPMPAWPPRSRYRVDPAGSHLLLVVLVNIRRETGGAELRVAREPAIEPVDAERREGRRTLAASDDPARQVLTDGR
jgi:hypothetical protein